MLSYGYVILRRREAPSRRTHVSSCTTPSTLTQQLLDRRAGAGEVDRPGVALAQGRHHPAHILGPGGAGVGDRGFCRGGDLIIAHLARQEALDDRDLLLFLLRQLGAVALAAEADRFAALLHPPLEDGQDLRIGGALPGSARARGHH